MAAESKMIRCPNCGQEIDVNEIVYHELEERLSREFNEKSAKQQKDLKEKEVALEKDKKRLMLQEQTIEAKIEEEVKVRVKIESEGIKKQAQIQAEEVQSERIESLESELKEKSKQVKELNKSKAEIERLKREKDELKEEIEAESEKKLTELLKAERKKIRREAEERTGLQLTEKEQLIDSLREQLKNAQRKMEQGSSQAKGEAQELEIEEWLRTTYPLDTIEEIRKGAQGADCIQTVNSRTRTNCGTIYYESKRTKSFQASWIEKFRGDIREKNASIGVLVTESTPTDMERMGLRDGIWICSYGEFKGLTAVLRETIVQLNEIAASQVNKGSKMEMLYDYLTGTEFRLQVEAIVEGFTQMKRDLESEKRAIQSQWKKREKQIEKVLLNTTNMYSSVKGLAGNEIQSVRMLEFSEKEDGKVGEDT